MTKISLQVDVFSPAPTSPSQPNRPYSDLPSTPNPNTHTPSPPPRAHTGTGKTELINSLLDRPAAAGTNPFRPATTRVRVLRGSHNGIQLTCIDTPGLLPAACRTADNKAILRAIRSAYRWHKPDYVFYVDR